MSLFAEHSLRSAGQDPDCPSVILCAATGKCADLIGKLTKTENQLVNESSVITFQVA